MIWVTVFWHVLKLEIFPEWKSAVFLNKYYTGMQIKNKGYKVWEIIIHGYDHLLRKMWTSLRDWGKLSKEERARERNGERERLI